MGLILEKVSKELVKREVLCQKHYSPFLIAGLRSSGSCEFFFKPYILEYKSVLIRCFHHILLVFIEKYTHLCWKKYSWNHSLTCYLLFKATFWAKLERKGWAIQIPKIEFFLSNKWILFHSTQRTGIFLFMNNKYWCWYEYE